MDDRFAGQLIRCDVLQTDLNIGYILQLFGYGVERFRGGAFLGPQSAQQ
jgi:hypothetical protein